MSEWMCAIGIICILISIITSKTAFRRGMLKQRELYEEQTELMRDQIQKKIEQSMVSPGNEWCTKKNGR